MLSRGTGYCVNETALEDSLWQILLGEILAQDDSVAGGMVGHTYREEKTVKAPSILFIDRFSNPLGVAPDGFKKMTLVAVNRKSLKK